MERSKLKTQAPPVFVINALSYADVAVMKPAVGKKEMTFEIDRAQKKNALDVLKKKNVTCEVIGERGIKTSLKQLFSRIGMWIGLVAGLVLVFLYSTTITKIEVTGCERVPEEEIKAAAEVRLFSLFENVSTEAVEAKLMGMKGISGVSAVRKGTTLSITVTESLDAPDIVDTTTPEPLVAASDGVILRIVVVQGTAAVKTGDTVKKGDTLIMPYVTDAEGAMQPVRAMGEVFATVYLQKHVFCSDTAMSAVRTGNVKKITVMEIPGLPYKKSPDFVSYETETIRYRASNLLPFYLTETTYYETREELITVDFEKHRDALVKENLTALKREIPYGATPVKWWTMEKRLDKNTILSIYYQIETPIAVRPGN